jgi:hypothetical protein
VGITVVAGSVEVASGEGAGGEEVESSPHAKGLARGKKRRKKRRRWRGEGRRELSNAKLFPLRYTL